MHLAISGMREASNMNTLRAETVLDLVGNTPLVRLNR